MSHFKQECIDDLLDTLDSLSESEAYKIFNKLTSLELVKLKQAVQAAIKDAAEKAVDEVRESYEYESQVE